AVVLLKKVVARESNWGDYGPWRDLIEASAEAGDRPAALAACRELHRLAPVLHHRCLLAEHLLAAGEKAAARQVPQGGLEEYQYLSGRSRRRDRPWVGRARQLLAQTG